MAIPVEVTAEPVDEGSCKFVLSRAVAGPGILVYMSGDDAADSPVAQAVLRIPGVTEVVLSGDVMTVMKSDSAGAWAELEPQVRYAVNEGVTHMSETNQAADQQLDDDAIFAMAKEIFEKQINPAVASHGGMIELIDVQDATILVRLMGGCQGCGMATVTLRQGVEGALKDAIPGIKGVRDITDHSSGANPYYAS